MVIPALVSLGPSSDVVPAARCRTARNGRETGEKRARNGGVRGLSEHNGPGGKGANSHWRDCHFDGTPCLSLLKRLIKVQGGVVR